MSIQRKHAFLFLVASLFFLPTVQAGNLDPALMGLFPKDVSQFAYADLATARKLPWFPQFEAQVLPVQFHDFDQLMASAQLSADSPFDSVAWALLNPLSAADGRSAGTGAGILGLATGSFDADTVKSFAKGHNFRTVQLTDFQAFASGTGSGAGDLYFAFLDANTLAFGSLSTLQRLAGVRSGQEQSLYANEAMLPMIYQANRNGTFWGVLNTSSARAAIGQLIPEATQFPQSKNLLAKMTFLMISADTSDDGASLDFQAVAPSAQDALVLSQLLQAGVLLRRYQMGQSNGDLGEILDAVRVGANGPDLEISLTLSTDQLMSLIQHNVFTALS